MIRVPYKIQTDVFSREKVLLTLTRVQSIFNTLLKVASFSDSVRGWKKGENMTAGLDVGKFKEFIFAACL